MYILIPLILSAVCSFVNPYVGLFGIFTLVEIIIILCVDINANVRIKLSHKVSAENPSRAERMKKSGKVLATAECVLTAFFTIICYSISGNRASSGFRQEWPVEKKNRGATDS